MNNTYFIGRLVTDPELRETESGKKVVNVTVAVPRSYKNKDGNYDADFIDCAFWDHNAEYVSKMSKGNELAVQGRTETRLYEKDGNKIKDYKVVVDSCKNLDKSKENSNEMDM
ncbi:MAG: single-stranded DNA-binding protein [Bacilli bacterium]